MNLAILSCGPSLQAFLDEPVKHDEYMGVNRAVGAYPCDYWVGLDPRVFTETVPMTLTCECFPFIFTSDNVDARHPLPMSGWACRDSQLFAKVKGLDTLGSTPWRRWSGVYALMVGALVLGAKRLTLYGYDMAGFQFWDGKPVYRRACHPSPQTIDDTRWREEQHCFDSVVEWLIRRGVEVERVGDGSYVQESP